MGYDAGVHKCTVTDGLGNTGVATTDMNLYGMCIHNKLP